MGNDGSARIRWPGSVRMSGSLSSRMRDSNCESALKASSNVVQLSS